jgi:hypothetical protein
MLVVRRVSHGDTAILRDMYPTMTKLLAFFKDNTAAADGLLHPWSTSMVCVCAA